MRCAIYLFRSETTDQMPLSLKLVAAIKGVVLSFANRRNPARKATLDFFQQNWIKIAAINFTRL